MNLFRTKLDEIRSLIYLLPSIENISYKSENFSHRVDLYTKEFGTTISIKIKRKNYNSLLFGIFLRLKIYHTTWNNQKNSLQEKENSILFHYRII